MHSECESTKPLLNAKHSQQINEKDCQVNFEKIATEIDVLIHIFQLLEFRDQMHLARVNCLLQDVFKTFIWKENYCVMKIVENSNGNLLIQNGRGANWLYLESEDFQEFLQIFGNDAKELHASQSSVRFVRMPNKTVDGLALQGDFAADEEEIDYLEKNRRKKECSLASWRLMKNLSHLSLGGAYINRHNFDFMVKHLTFLESLELKVDVENDLAGYQDAYSYGKSLLQMKNLKRFTLAVSSPVMLTINYRIYRDLATVLNLEYLRVDMSLQHQEKFMHPKEMATKKPLSIKHLDISLTSDNYNCIETIMSSCFLNCENLMQLQLQLPELTLSQAALSILTCHCKNLEIFELKSSNVNCDEFKMPEPIKAVTLNACRGLTCDNLKQILSCENLIKFVSSKTPFNGQLSDVYISESLQFLECDSVATSHLMARPNALNNLRHLIWYDPLSGTADAETSLFACPHLERLHIASDPITLKALLHLQSLRILSFHHIYALNWSYVVDLLKQLPLHELKISQFCGAEAVDTPAVGFPTSVKLLHINMNMIVQADFWLDLFCKNLDLILIFFGQIGPFHLKRIFHKARFPKDLRTIEFSGINIKCDDLRRNFDETIRKTPFLKNYKSENYIKLCRNNGSGK